MNESERELLTVETESHEVGGETMEVQLDRSGEAPQSPRPTPGIVVKGLCKVFHDRRLGDVAAVDGVSFQCNYGEVFGLLGPNGAGKTTTLRILSTVLHATAGQAIVAGHDVNQEPLEVRRKIGYLSTATGLYGRLTARETLEYFGTLHGVDEKILPDRIQEVLQMFDMNDFADVRCEKLSTGMRQKVSIARAMVHDPPVLILDEPTLGLDILVASAMIGCIEASRARGKCVIFSTHVMSYVERLCDEIAILHRGHLRAVGTLQELRERTACEYPEEIFAALVRDEVPAEEWEEPEEEWT